VAGREQSRQIRPTCLTPFLLGSARSTRIGARLSSERTSKIGCAPRRKSCAITRNGAKSRESTDEGLAYGEAGGQGKAAPVDPLTSPGEEGLMIGDRRES
jgi:hypothetical protein